MLVEYGMQQLREPLSEIRSFDVAEEPIQTGISSADAQSLNLKWLDRNRINITGATSVILYSIDGRLLARFSGETELNLSDYPVEILIIKADDKTFKITNKR